MIPVAKPMMGPNEVTAAYGVITSGQLAAGPKVKEFEELWAEWQMQRFCLTVTNGTTALEAALSAMPKDMRTEVIVPAMTFNATSSAVRAAGYRPVFVDINDEYVIDPEAVLAAITPNTRAVLPVHLYGLMADMERLNKIADYHDLAIIEDAAQAHDSERDDQRPGSTSRSLAATYSFYATKNITTGGEGGAVTTNSELMRDRISLLREHGQSERYQHTSFGHNWRMTELQAAIGIAQMGALPDRQQRRRSNAARLTGSIWSDYIVVPPDPPGVVHGWHQYVIRLPDTSHREYVERLFKKHDIGTGRHYPVAEPDQPVNFSFRKAEFSNARRLAETGLSIPVGPWLKDDDLSKIEEVLVTL